MKRATLILALIMLPSCVISEGAYIEYLLKKEIPPTTESSFSHCRGYGCKYIDQVELNKKQWSKVEHAFRPRAKTAEKERAQIAKAIAIFEQEVGTLTGTNVDHYGTFKKLGTHQQDCVDESINTTIYLDLLLQRDLLKHHTIRPPEVRIPIINSGRWPHQTAAIVEIESGEAFAVDSWFHDNGFQAEIVPLKTWRGGWKPEEHRTSEDE